MNDLDLRIALQRDADLVGEPSPDLLDQLAQRRQRQHRQRAGMFTAGLAVAVIAAGIPIGASFMTRSDGGLATDPSPTVSIEAPAPAPAPAPSSAAPSSAALSSAAPSVAPVPEPVVDAFPPPTEPVACPDLATLRAALPADAPDRRFSMFDGEDPVCSGDWAAAGYSESRLVDGEWWNDGQAGLFRFADGSWTWLDRYTTDVCDDPAMPAAVRVRGCNVD